MGLVVAVVVGFSVGIVVAVIALGEYRHELVPRLKRLIGIGSDE
jgi:hypothetical protein